MGYAKDQLDEEQARAHEEYVKESICPECGEEREEITLDHNTFWLCDTCDGDDESYDDIGDEPPEEEDELWGSADCL
jgi:hypothetical protein